VARSGFDGNRETPLEQISSRGYGVIELDPRDKRQLDDLFEAARQFFARDGEWKIRHSVPDRNIGYREQGHAHAGSPESLDLNESFLYWKGRRALYPDPEEIGVLLSALDEYEVVVARLIREILDDLRDGYRYEGPLDFEDDSLIQINFFSLASRRELLQQSHEDATLLTIIAADSTGLEIIRDGVAEPVDLETSQMLVMPGSTMTKMTGGRIPPLYHQVRNLGRLGRLSVPYFVNLSTARPIDPFVVNDTNRFLDIREHIADVPRKFGLKGDFPPRLDEEA
jgi:isopenicillin N synthase-like dioxygenase